MIDSGLSRRGLIAAGAGALASPAFAAGAGGFEYKGTLLQGGYLIGRSAPRSMVSLNGEASGRAAADGVFIVGFDRDEAPSAVVAVHEDQGRTLQERLTVGPSVYDIQRIDGLPDDQVEPTASPVARVDGPSSDAQQKAAERIERRLRLRVTAGDVDSTAQQLWARSLESERERRVTDRHTLTGGSLPTIRGHVSRDLDRELAHEMEKRSDGATPPGHSNAPLTADEAAWEASRLNVVLANKGYTDSDITRWWNFTRHRELGDQTVDEAWRAGNYSACSRLIQSLPDAPDLGRSKSNHS